jgi:uncharacterized protein (DUF1800 family)
MTLNLIETEISTDRASAPAAVRANLAPASVLIPAAALLTACGGGGGGGLTAGETAAPSGGRSVTLSALGYRYPSATTDAQAARFLLQAQLSASDADIAAVKDKGFASWLEQQVAIPAGMTGWDWLNNKGYGDVLNPANFYDSASPGDYMAWSQLIEAPDPFRKRCALALSEFFVVSLSGLSFAWRSHAVAHYWDTLCAHAHGNYRDLLEAITLNAAMGYFLNTKGNKKENSAGRQPDENYAREVMQLFSAGLVLLQPDGSPMLGADGKTQDTYTASDVSNLARVFTGYDVDTSQNAITSVPQTGGGIRNVGNTAFARLPMVLNASNHSNLAVSFLGTSIAANTPGAAALSTALDTLFNHPNTAPFFCKQMIQRLVTSNPSPAYVARVAGVFGNNGKGVRGDLAHVFFAILLDDEARSPMGLSATDYGKLREPMLRFVQWARSFGVASASGAWKIGDLSNPGTQLGQSPLRAPSVFNFFRPGYVPPSAALGAELVAPEFQLVTESSVGGYLNYMMGILDTGINSGDIKATYTREIALAMVPTANNPTDLVARLNLVLCAGQLSEQTANTISSTVGAMAGVVTSATSTATNLRRRVCAAVLLVMASSEFLVQK